MAAGMCTHEITVLPRQQDSKCHMPLFKRCMMWRQQVQFSGEDIGSGAHYEAQIPCLVRDPQRILWVCAAKPGNQYVTVTKCASVRLIVFDGCTSTSCNMGNGALQLLPDRMSTGVTAAVTLVTAHLAGTPPSRP